MTYKSIKTNKNIKATIVALMFLLTSFSLCSVIKYKEHNLFKKVNVYYTLPLLKNNGDLVTLTDSLSIVYSKKSILYELPYYFSIIKNDSIVSTKTKFKYFIYQKGAEEGCWFDSINAINKKKEKIFSVHKEKTFLNPPDLFDEKNLNLINIKRNKGEYSLIESYINRIKKDITYSDTIIVYYKNKFENIDYSISKKLDSIKGKGLKVVKIRLIYNSKFVKGYSYRFPKRELIISIKEDTVSNLSKYEDFINAFNDKFKP